MFLVIQKNAHLQCTRSQAQKISKQKPNRPLCQTLQQNLHKHTTKKFVSTQKQVLETQTLTKFDLKS
jgi:hypothetical protein